MNGKAVNVVNSRIGTRTEHYLAYLSNAMGVLDKNNMKAHYLVMDNAPIHTLSMVRSLIECRGYRCIGPHTAITNFLEKSGIICKVQVEKFPWVPEC